MRPIAAASIVSIGLLALGCQHKVSPKEPASQEAKLQATTELADSLQRLIDSTVADQESIYGAALYVAAPRLGLEFEGAAGLADPDTGIEMTPFHPVRIASNTKTYVAAAALRLREEGKLELDDPISRYLGDELLEVLRGDGYDPDAITIRHLLTHTSGIFDHSDTPDYIEAITADPGHTWTRSEQVLAAAAWGDPLGEPGEIYRYSDTGYVILGEIVAKAGGMPMAAAVRELLDFERLGLASTWWETLEPRPEGAPERAHQYLGDVDTFGFDPSLDLYGGGGLVATVRDMGRFLRALFTGDVYKSPESTATMLTALEGAKASGQEGQLPPGMYRMGIWVLDVDGYETYRHSGFWGTVAIYVPELDLAVACTVNQGQAGAVLNKITGRAIALVAEAIADLGRG